MPSRAARSSLPRPCARKASTSIPHYKYVVCEWPYIRPYLADDFDMPNARDIRDRSFNLYLNEKYGEQEAKDTVAAIRKVEGHFAKA